MSSSEYPHFEQSSSEKPPAEHATGESLFVENLRLLHDVLASSGFLQNSFLWGGVLLGAIREGRILSWDTNDVDFGYFRPERGLLLKATPALVEAGFLPHSWWVDLSGEIVRYVFRKEGIAFDFFELEAHGEEAHYWQHWKMHNHRAWIEIVGSIPLSTFTTLDFLGCSWRIPANYEDVLMACYGDWRVPVASADYHPIRVGVKLVSHRLWQGASDPGKRVKVGATDFEAKDINP